MPFEDLSLGKKIKFSSAHVLVENKKYIYIMKWICFYCKERYKIAYKIYHLKTNEHKMTKIEFEKR